MKSARIRCQPGLPIRRFWDRLVSLIKKDQVIIVTGETGSGKTTQLPKICLAAGRGARLKIACTQPRRLAAISVAHRVARELHGSGAGTGIVGYKIRFQDRTDRNTRIKFLTDGMLLSEMQADRNLSAYDTVILDEAHERSLNIDLLAGMLKRLLKKRRDLNLIITSATMEVEKFRKFFDNPPLFQIEGRTYPVDILYEDPLKKTGRQHPDLMKQVKRAVARIRDIDPFGHILVFLPTERDIFETKRILTGSFEDACLILPLFARLSSRDQQRIFARTSRQKIVLATNIAETSITVPGIRYIVDSGLARISRYNVNTHTRALPVSGISKASADQRAGRAGRVQAGICIRLFSKEDYSSRPDHTPPEILRCSLAEVILRLLYLGQGPVENFPFVDPPPRRAVREGIHTLKELGALDAGERLTSLGRKMARLPLDPRLSRMIVQAASENCLREVLITASALSIQDPRQRPAEKEAQAAAAQKVFQDEASDFVTFINLWNTYFSLKGRGASKSKLRRFCRKHFLSYHRMAEWEDIFDQLLSTLNDIKVVKKSGVIKYIKSTEVDLTGRLRESVHRSILSGFLGNVAMKDDSNIYTGAKGKEIYLFPGSCLFSRQPKWICSAAQIRTSKLFARTAAPIKPEWIEEFGGHLCKYSYFEPRWSASRGEAVCTEKVSLYGLTIIPGRQCPLKRKDPELARRLLASEGLAYCRLKNRFAFNERNKRLMDSLKELEEKQRSSSHIIDHEILHDFFLRALEGLERKTGFRIVDEADLKKAIRTVKGSENAFMLDERILFEEVRCTSSERLYPGHLVINGRKLALTYRFCPGCDDDGITVGVPLMLLPEMDDLILEWLVPGFLEEKVEFILKHLPKKIRAGIFDYKKTASKLCQRLLERPVDFQKDLLKLTGQLLDRQIAPGDLAGIPKLPRHLVMRIELLGKHNRIIEASRDLKELREKYLSQARRQLLESRQWQKARKRWERKITAASLDKLPSSMEIGTINGIKITGYPSLIMDSGKKEVAVRLISDPREAIEKSLDGIHCLLERELKQETVYLSKKIRNRLVMAAGKTHSLKSTIDFPLLTTDRLMENILKLVFNEFFGTWDHIPSRMELQDRAIRIRKTLVRDSEDLLELIVKAISAWREYLTRKDNIAAQLPSGCGRAVVAEIDQMAQELVSHEFPSDRSVVFLREIPRFIKGLDIRLQRAVENPARDMEKQKRFQPVFQSFKKIERNIPHGFAAGPKKTQELELCVWEFMLSVFAPELSVRGRASRKKLNTLLNIIEENPYQ